MEKDLNPGQKNIHFNSIKAYNSTLTHLKGFIKSKKRTSKLLDINQRWIDDFKNYLINDLHLALNTVGKYMQVFLLMIKYAITLRIIPSNFLLENKIVVHREKSDNIYLNESELEALISIKKFNTKNHEIVRDLFLIGCHTGLRFSDYSRIKKENIKEDFIEIRQSKTTGKVVIPIHPNVKKLLEKYQYNLPKCPCNQVFNRYIKEIGKKIPQLNTSFDKLMTRNNQSEIKSIPKWKMIQTHTARRTFCTNQYLKKVPVITIMAISGHTTQKSFMSYIKATGREHAEILKGEWES